MTLKIRRNYTRTLACIYAFAWQRRSVPGCVVPRNLDFVIINSVMIFWNRSDYDVFVDYVEKNNPIDITVEGRITIVYGGDSGETTTSPGGGDSGSDRLKFSCLLLMTTIFVWTVLEGKI